MAPRIHESHIEEAALNWFEELGWVTLHGPDIAPNEPASVACVRLADQQTMIPTGILAKCRDCWSVKCRDEESRQVSRQSVGIQTCLGNAPGNLATFPAIVARYSSFLFENWEIPPRTNHDPYLRISR